MNLVPYNSKHIFVVQLFHVTTVHTLPTSHYFYSLPKERSSPLDYSWKCLVELLPSLPSRTVAKFLYSRFKSGHEIQWRIHHDESIGFPVVILSSGRPSTVKKGGKGQTKEKLRKEWWEAVIESTQELQ